MKRETEVIVIGAGAIGICTAYYLWKNGLDVTVIEKGEIGSGCSYGNAGLIVPSHFIPLAAPGVIAQGLKWMFNPNSPFYIKPRLNLELLSWIWKFRGACNEKHVQRSIPVLRDLSLASLSLFEELSRLEDLDFGFEKKGMLMLYKSDKGAEECLEMADLAQEIGLDARKLNNAQIHELEPSIETHATGGVYFNQDAHLDPACFVQNLSRYLEQKGMKIHTLTEVIGFDKSNGKIIKLKTTRGDFFADEVVLAGGAWSPAIVRDLQLKLPIQPAKGYSVTVKQPAIKPRIPLVLTEAKVAVTPIGNSLRFAGTLELAGLDLSINKRRVNAILNSIPDYISNFNLKDINQIKPWAGLRPCTPDGLPFIGRFKAFENLIAAQISEADEHNFWFHNDLRNYLTTN